MGINAGKGIAPHEYSVAAVSKRLTFDDAGETISLGWLPRNSFVIGSGVSIVTASDATASTLDIGFQDSEEGHTDDPNAFTETALDIDAAVGHLAGDVVSAANLYFSEPAEITATWTDATGTSTAGEVFAYVTFVVAGTSEDL